jgi:hypothetical protein
MKKILNVTVLLCCICLIISCNTEKNKYNSDDPVSQSADSEEKEDGIRESQEMEFQLTKDPKLGYVPQQRLINAYEKLAAERRQGLPLRLNALSWTERGPYTDALGPSNGNFRGPSGSVTSGRIRAIWVDLSDATNKTVWAASVSGGLWKTSDITAATPTWNLINDFFGNLAIGAISQDPVNKSIMYFGTGEKAFNADAVRGGGVWKSIDAGQTWSLLASTTSFYNISKIVCDGTGNVYVGTLGSGSGLRRSSDGGLTWTNITPTTTNGGSRITEMSLSSTGRLHVIVGYYNSTAATSGYFFTDNPGTVTTATWDSPVTPIPNNFYNCELAVAGNTLYALPSNASFQTPTIYKSNDGAVTWFALPANPSNISSGQAWFCLAIGVDPANTDNVIAGGLNFHRTTDGGTTWTKLSDWASALEMYIHADHHSVKWNASQVLVATDGGIFYSSDNGATFVHKNIGLRIKQFYSCAIHPSSTNYFLAGAQDNGTHKLSSAGLSSSEEVHGGDGGFVHIDEDEPTYQFSATTRSSYRRSINNGSTWQAVSYSGTIGQFINPTDYDDINNKLYTSAGDGDYVIWDNPQSGSTFKTVSMPGFTSDAILSVKVSPYTSNRVYFGTNAGKIIRSDNAGSASPVFTNLALGAGMPGGSITCVNTGTSDNNLIAVFSNYGVQNVWVSSNGGTNWSAVDGNLPDMPVRWAMFHPEDNDRVIIATEAGVFETDDVNGSSTVWVQNSSFPFVKTNMLQYRVADRTLLAATHGRGLWTSSIAGAAPYIRFAGSYSYSRPYGESTVSTDGCRNYRDVLINMAIDAAPTGNANVTLSVTGGTAVEGVDFDITTNGNFTTPSKLVNFLNGSVVQQQVTVRIYDDAEIESNESFILSYSVAGATNALVAPSATNYTVYIGDNDSAPVSNGTINLTVGNSNYGTYVQPFRGEYAKARSQYLYTAADFTSAGLSAGVINSLALNVVSKGSTQPYNSLSISLKNTTITNFSGGLETGFTNCYSGNYSTVVGINTFSFNVAPFNWDGVSNVVLEICYNNTAGSASDAVSSNTTTFQSGIWLRDNSIIPGCELTTGLFSGVGSTQVRPDIIFPLPYNTPIETVLNRTKTNYIFGAGLNYFYSQGFNNLLGIVNNSTATLGCVNMSIQEAGTTWQSFFSGQRSQKVFDISVANNPSANYTIGFYVTNAELGGKTASTVNIAGTAAATAAGASSLNTVIYPTTVTTLGNGYLFTATVTGGARFFLTDAVVTGITNVNERIQNFVKLIQNPVLNTIYLNISNENRSTIGAVLYTLNGQTLKTWSLGRVSGNTQLEIGSMNLPAGTYLLSMRINDKMQNIKVVKK